MMALWYCNVTLFTAESAYDSAVNRSATCSILVVDDDPDMLDHMSDCLRSAGHSVWPASSASEARALVRRQHPDLVVLDLILPDADGLLLCQSLREKIEAPIVIVSGTQRSRDAVLALRIGADDFIGKPFDPDEFEARVGALLRRRPITAAANPADTARAVYGLDAARQAVRVGDESIRLTPIEYRVLEMLASRAGELVRHEEIAETIWGRGMDELGRAVDTQARRLRKKLLGRPAAPRIVKKHGQGYVLLPGDETEPDDQWGPEGDQ
jgi:DNA-binding response OmpR family regulator